MNVENPKKPKSKALLIDNSVLYNELRTSVVSPESWNMTRYGAECDLTTSTKSIKAVARIGPEPGIEGRLNDSAIDEWRQKVADYVLTKMDDLNADLLDYIFAYWIQRSSSPEQTVVISAEDFFKCRGLRPRSHSYWTAQKKEIAERIALLSNTWINLQDAEAYGQDSKGRRKKQRQLKSRAIVVSTAAEESSENGEKEFYFKLRPGDLFLGMLCSKTGKQLALMSQKVLEYDYYRYPWEKRCARYFTWLHRIRQGRGEYLKGVRVRSLLEGIRKEVSPGNPRKTKNRLEQALDTLCKDKIFSSWQYQKCNEEIVGKKGWVQHWLDWVLIVEPSQEVLDQYEKIKPLPASKNERVINIHPPCSELVENMKAKRKERSMTQLQAAEEIGIAPNYYAMLERGVREPSGRLATVITKWLKG